MGAEPKRSGMHSWEIVCITVDTDSEFTDCRAIEELGYLAPTLKRKSADVVGAQIHQGHREFHVDADGERLQLQADHDPAVNFYVRTRDEDSNDDPLLALRSCTEYELDDKLEDVA